jgi:hypothetical protein
MRLSDPVPFPALFWVVGRLGFELLKFQHGGNVACSCSHPSHRNLQAHEAPGRSRAVAAARDRSFNCADWFGAPTGLPPWRGDSTGQEAARSSSPTRFCQSSACLHRALCSCQVVLLFHLMRRLQSSDGFLLRSIRVLNPSVKSTSICVHGTVGSGEKKNPTSKSFHAD